MDRQAKLVQKYREDTDREEWALVSRKDNSKVLEWFGPEKPSDEKVQKAEARVQFFKHHASLGVKPLLQETKRRRSLIDQALQKGDVGAAKKLFVELGEKLRPLASALDGVTITRADEARKLKNVKLWLRQISYPFDPKDLNGPHADVYISQGIVTVEDALKSLSRVESRLEEYQNVEAEFKHGPFTVINKHGFRPDEYGDALSVLDEAAQKIQAKGFSSVVYGKVYLVSAGQGKMRKGWAGMYREGTDEFLLNVEARHRHDSIFTIVHELGHRHWHKGLSGAQRVLYEALYSQGALTLGARQDMWQALVKGQFSPRKALPFLRDKSRADDLFAYFKDQYSATGLSQGELLRAYERGETWVEQNFVRPRSPYVFIGDPGSKKTVTVSDYAKTNVKEDYAETFAFYVLGMPIPPEVMERFRPAIGKTARELTAGFIPDEWIDAQKKALKALLGKKVKHKVTASPEAMKPYVEEVRKFLTKVDEDCQRMADTPYYARITGRAMEDAQNALDRAERSFKELADTLAVGTTDDAYTAFVKGTILAKFNRVKKTVGDVVDGSWGYLSPYDLRELTDRFRQAGKKEGIDPSDTKAVTDFLKKIKAQPKAARIFEHKVFSTVSRVLVEHFSFLQQSVAEESYLHESLTKAVREFSIGKAKVVILDPSMDPQTDARVMKQFQAAKAKIDRAGFGKVWYGTILVMDYKGGKLSEEDQKQYRALGYDIAGFNGVYRKGPDIVEHWTTPEGTDTLIHEMGHRYWYKLMTSEQRARFNSLIQISSKREVKQDDGSVKMIDLNDETDLPADTKDTLGRDKPALPVSVYGKSNLAEAFAEAFMYYVTGKHMDNEQKATFKSVLKKLASAESVVRRVQADLAPQLGKPGGPCQVVRRVLKEIRNPRLQDQLRDKVEDGVSLSNPDAAKVYDRLLEKAKGVANKILMGPHAQYRMDLRGITVKDIRDAIMDFSKWVAKLKKDGDPRGDQIQRMVDQSEPIKYTSPKGLTIVIDFEDKGFAQLITTYWQNGVSVPKPQGECPVNAATAETVVARHLKLALTWNEALEALGFAPNTYPSDADVNTAFRQKYIENRRLHPDTGGDQAEAVKLNAAKDTLIGKLKPDHDVGFRSPPPNSATPPTGTGEPYKPPPARPKVRVTFEEALSKVAVPSGIKWLFVTTSGYAGYSGDESSRYTTVRVAVGETKDQWYALVMKNSVMQSYIIGMEQDDDVWEMDGVFGQKGDPAHAKLYKLVLAAWNKSGVKKRWDSKIYPVPDGWKVSEKGIRSVSGGNKTTIKNWAVDSGVVKEEDLGTPRKVEVIMRMSEDRDADWRDRDEYTLILNGKEYKLSKAENAKARKAGRVGLASFVFDRYYPGSKKVLNRAKKGKQVMEWMLRELTSMPSWVQDGLKVAINPPAAPAKGKGRRADDETLLARVVERSASAS